MAKQIADGIDKEVISELRELAEGGHIEIIKRKLKGKFTLPAKEEVFISEDLYPEIKEMLDKDLQDSRND